MSVFLGLGMADISPPWPVQLAGFGSRRGALISTIADPIMARVAVFDDGDALMVVVSGELLNWSTESDERFRSTVAEITGAPGERILFSATHTHSAPQVSHLHAPTLGVVDERYLDFLEEQVAGACREAMTNRMPVTASRARGRFALAEQRRAELDLLVNPAVPRVDDELSVVAFRAEDDTVAAVLVHYSCHPVVNADNCVTGDFFGAAMSAVERATGAVAFPLQGCCGDINPGGDAAFAGPERAARIGEDLAAAVGELLAGPRQEVELGGLSAHWATADLPFTRVTSAAELDDLKDADGLAGEWARALRAYPEMVRPHATCRLQLMAFGCDLHLLAMSGEVTTEYGLHIKEASAGRVMPVAYSNGMIGYIPTARQVRAGGYEVEDAARCYLLAGTFSTEIEPRMMATIDGLLAIADFEWKPDGTLPQPNP